MPTSRCPRPRRARPAVLISIGVVAALLAGCTTHQPGPSASHASGAFDPALAQLPVVAGGSGHLFSAVLARDVAADPSLRKLTGLGAALDQVADGLVGDAAAGVRSPSRVRAKSGAASSDGAAVAPAVYRPIDSRRVAVQAGTGGGYDMSSAGTVFGMLSTMAGGAAPAPFTVSGSSSQDGATVEGTMTMSPDGVDFTMGVTKGGVSYSSSVKGRAAGNPCPDADGKVVATVELTLGGGAGPGTSIRATATGTVDDSASLADVTVDGEHQTSGSGASGRSQVVQHVTVTGVDLTRPSAGNGSVDVTTVMVSGMSDADAYAAQGAAAGDVFRYALGVLMAWQQAWRSGQCVELAADLPATVEPSSSTPFTVTARGSGGGQIEVPVKASLSDGGVSVSPGSARTTASFAYVAPDGSDKKATVALESVSHRGIGRLSVHVTTKKRTFAASGGSDGLTFSGSYHEGAAAFSLQVAFPGGSGDFSYVATAADGRSGTLTVDVSGSGATGTGSGSWSMTENDDGTRTITEKVHACVDVSGVCNDTSQTVTLTPTG